MPLRAWPLESTDCGPWRESKGKLHGNPPLDPPLVGGPTCLLDLPQAGGRFVFQLSEFSCTCLRLRPFVQRQLANFWAKKGRLRTTA